VLVADTYNVNSLYNFGSLKEPTNSKIVLITMSLSYELLSLFEPKPPYGYLKEDLC
jgi:hypothetical protein